MLGSFDYAARPAAKDLHSIESSAAQITYRADEWVDRNRHAFLEATLSTQQARARSPRTRRRSVDAYEADKAVYEVVYEARNRPTWLDIPLHAIDRIGADHE